MRRDTVSRVVVVALACACMLLVLAGRAMAESTVHVPQQHKPNFIHFGVEQGLSSTINDLAVDHQGYIWVATGDGLARYDGAKFRYWRRIVGDPASLPDNEVTLVHVDAKDRVWAATWFALSVLDPDHRVPRTIQFTGDAARCGIDITAMTSAPDGVLWIGNRVGDICQIGLNGFVERFHGSIGERSFFGDYIPVAMKMLSSGNLLVGTNDGLFVLEISHRRTRQKILNKKIISQDPVFILTSSADGAVWAGGENGPIFFDSDGIKKKIAWKGEKKLRRAAIIGLNNENYWIGSYYGLFLGNKNSIVEIGTGNGFGIDSGISRIIQDIENGFWFSSYSEGLFYLSTTNDFFWLIPNGVPDKSTDFFGSEMDVNGNLLILTKSGLFFSKKSIDKFNKLAFIPKNNFDDRFIISNCENGYIFVSDGHGLFSFKSANDGFQRLPELYAEKNWGKHESIRCAIDGRVWVSMLGGGILLYSKEGWLVKEFLPQETLGEEAEAFIDLRFSPDGSPWYSDGKDLRRWDGHRFVRVPLPAGEYVYSLDFLSASQIWVARFGSLERYEWDGTALRLRERVTTQEGLPAVEARSVLVTSAGNIWLNTVRGLVHYDPRQHRARLFGLKDGLPGLDFTVDVLKRRSDGPVVATSREGVVMFDPDRPLPEPRASALVVEEIELRRGEDVVPFSRYGDADLRAVMQPGDRDLRIAARVMSFADPSAFRYRFKLGGFDPDWVDQGDRGERVFSSLSPGNYVLEVQGANADGVWSATRRIEILVMAPWWQRWWALVCYAIAIAMLLWWVAYLYRLRLRRRHDYQLIAQKREVAEQASQAKSRFLANLGHEVRTPMTGVLGMSELLLSTSLDKKQQGQVHAIRRAGEHLLRLVNDALDLARIEAGRLELEVADFDLDALVEDVIALMRPLADRKGLTLRVAVAHDAGGGWCGDPTRLRQILLNLLGNAVKFTERGEVALMIETDMQNGLCLVVSDTGPGLDAEQQQRLFRRFEQAEGARTSSRYGGSGLGLAICQELASAMGGGIELRSVPGEGTRFTVRLPLERSETMRLHAQRSHQEGAMVACDVLLVEDDAIVADVLVGMLQAQGHRVIHAGHALAAMTEIAVRSFDIALLDLDLPGMDGLALVRQLRAQGLTIPIIAITARADSAAESDAKDAGFDAFLRKPLTGDALGDALHDRLVKRIVTD